jgi:hypothetical protein
MAAPYHNLLSKCDRAIAAYIISLGAGTAADVLPAKLSRTKSLPCTIVWSENGTELVPYSGDYQVKTTVMVKCKAAVDVGREADSARVASEDRVAKTFDAFHTNISTSGNPNNSGVNLADAITTAGRLLAAEDSVNHGDMVDFTVLDVLIKGPEASFEEDGAAWVDSMNLELIVCPGNVSDAIVT